jgi:hypothetical protein
LTNQLLAHRVCRSIHPCPLTEISRQIQDLDRLGIVLPCAILFADHDATLASQQLSPSRPLGASSKQFDVERDRSPCSRNRRAFYTRPQRLVVLNIETERLTLSCTIQPANRFRLSPL